MGLNTSFDMQDNILIVRLSGELDHHESELLREMWKEAIETNAVKHVVLNLKDVTFMDSSGLGVVLGRYKEIAQLGGEMIICAVTPPVNRLFEMSGLFKIVQLKESETSALSALGVAS